MARQSMPTTPTSPAASTPFKPVVVGLRLGFLLVGKGEWHVERTFPSRAEAEGVLTDVSKLKLGVDGLYRPVHWLRVGASYELVPLTKQLPTSISDRCTGSKR